MRSGWFWADTQPDEIVLFDRTGKRRGAVWRESSVRATWTTRSGSYFTREHAMRAEERRHWLPSPAPYREAEGPRPA